MRATSLVVLAFLTSGVSFLGAACSGPTSSADGDGGASSPIDDDGGTRSGDGSSNSGSRVEPTRYRVGAGADYSCALTSGGVVKCWGRNDKGQLGLGDTQNRGDGPNEMGDKNPGVDLGGKAVAVAVGWYHACALLDDGKVKCWGQNDSGQLGQGDSKNRGDGGGELGDNLPAISLAGQAVAISAGGYHSCALLDDGAVQCWGANKYGQLGLGDTKNRGDSGNQMGSSLPRVELGKGRTAVNISAGNLHTCAALDNGALKCWGDGADGQLGLGNTNHRGDAPNEMGDDLPAVSLGAGKVVGVGTGGFHTCAVFDSGALKCWGHNDQGQQGNGDKIKRGDQEGQMGDALPAVKLGQGRRAKQVSAVYDHTCVVLDDGSVKCFGWNNSGQLGLGDKNSRGDSADEMGDALPAVQLGGGRTGTQVGAGWDHTCAALDDGSVKCWGLNSAGHLGIGDRNARGDGPNEMGDALPAVQL